MDTCLNWKSEELQKLAEQVGVQATPAFADKVGVLIEKLGLNKEIILSEEEIDEINDDIDDLNNRISLLEGQLNLYEVDSEQYNVISVDLNKSKSELSKLENKLNQPQLPTPQQVKDYLEKNKPVKPVTTTIKPGVTELFESNPELANAVYETLGFKTKSEIGVSNRIFNPDMAPDGYSRIITLNGKHIGEFALLDVGNEVRLSGSLGARTEINTKYRGKGYGYQAYIELAKQVKSEDKVLVSGTNMTEDAIRVWEKLVKEGYANKVKRLVEGFDNFEEEVYIIDNSKLAISEITPQQKQKAQQLYSQYLDTIFPDSKVKDIVYHGTDEDISEGFDASKKKPASGSNSPHMVGHVYTAFQKHSTLPYITGVGTKFNNVKFITQYFEVKELFKALNKKDEDDISWQSKPIKELIASNKHVSEFAIKYNLPSNTSLETLLRNVYDVDINKSFNEWRESKSKEFKELKSLKTPFALLVNLLNPIIGKAKDTRYQNEIAQANKNNNDGLVMYDNNDAFNSDVVVVFDPKQIHTLGSKKDTEGFSKFTKEQSKKESRKRLAHAEVLLPAWMSSFFGPEFRTADNTVDFDKLNEMIGERGFKGLGYRIPTEDKYSLLPIKVIGFLPESGGGAIMLPAEITTIAGSDFDVDKMYTIFKNMRQIVNKDGQTEFKVIEYLDNSNSTVEERWKIVANTKPAVRAVKDKYSEAIEAAQKTLDRSIKIQRDKLDKLKTEKKSQEEQINNLTEEIEVTKLERELAFDMVEMLTTELNRRKDALSSPEELQSLYDNIDTNKTIIKNSNEALEKLYQQRSELSKTKFRKEDVEARYNKKNEAFHKYLKAKNDVIADMWKEVDTVFPLKDFEKLPIAEQNIRQARDNHKLDLMLTVMSSEHTTLSVLSPGGYDYLKNTVMANIIKNKGGVKKAKNIFSLNDIDMMTLQNLAGKALVGIAANHNKHHTLRQWSNLSLVSPVLFDNQSFVSLHNKEAYSVDGSQRTITRNLAEILAAVVDNAKDPVANVLNYNEHTADLISMLIGTGADINTVFAFVNQPIFTQAMELLNTRKEKNLVDAIKKAAEMNELTLPVDNKKIKARNLNLGDLNKNMTKFNKGFQYEVAISALAYIKQSKDLGLLIRASKADTAGIGQRVEDGVYLETQINDAKEIKTINGVEEFLNESSRFTKMFTEYGVSKPLSILEEMYPYSKKEFKELKSDLEAFIPGELSADDRQEINRAYIQYKMHKFGYYKYANREAIVKSTPALLEQIKDKYPELKDSNYLIRYLQVNYGNKDAGIPIIEFPNSLTSSEEQVNKSKQSWKEMFNESARQNLIDFINTKVPEKQRNELATKTDGFTNLIKVWNDRNLFQSDEAKKVLKDFVLNHLANSLIRYSFFTTGHEFTPTSIKQLIPVDVYMNLKDDSGMTIGRYENMLLQQAENRTDYRNFIDQFIRHRYAIPKYVARVADDKSNISSYDSKTDTIIVGIDVIKANNPLIKGDEKEGYLPTSMYITIKDGNNYKLYAAVGGVEGDVSIYGDYTFSTGEYIAFKRVEALGISNRVEYSTDPTERSLYKKNNVVPPSSQPPTTPVAPTPVPPVKDPEGLVTDKEADDRLKICKL